MRRRRPIPSARPDRDNTSSCYAWAAGRPGTRPQYLWSSLHAGRLAAALGHDEVAVAEFGVAGGNGLLALEAAADIVESLFAVRLLVYGFDVVKGMPESSDARDLPWAIEAGIFPMDEAALRARLRRASLVLGPVEETVPQWLEEARVPLGFAAFDLDLYSSTAAAFRIFEAPAEALLPRVACYFDDIFGYGWSDYAGERAAITEFNGGHDVRKIGKVHGLKYELPSEDFTRPWPEQIYMAHIFDSPDYNRLEAPLSEAWAEAHRLPED